MTQLVKKRVLISLTLIIVAVVGFHSSGKSVTGTPKQSWPEFTSVRLSGGDTLAVGRYEITVEQWEACTLSGGCPNLLTSRELGANHPVVNVNWFDVQSYIAWFRKETGLRVRLPTQREWLEIADEHTPPKKQKLFKDPRLSWAADYDLTAVPPIKTTRMSGSFGTNSRGVSDLKGNVWEWTATQCGTGQALGMDGCRSGRVLMGDHVAVLSDIIRDPGNASCGAGIPPANLGFRLVY